MMRNKNLEAIVTELFICGRKLTISLVFVTQSYFIVQTNVRLNSLYYFIINIPNKPELQQIAFNNSPCTEFVQFSRIYIKYTNESWPFLVNVIPLSPDKPLRFRKNFLE